MPTTSLSGFVCLLEVFKSRAAYIALGRDTTRHGASHPLLISLLSPYLTCLSQPEFCNPITLLSWQLAVSHHIYKSH
ncbi:hypothetical protein B0T21DRAFT_355927 [Apiosordaria backusii]|uniref:Uncharacterized protein n=1 Tax=Apiosordaria backusii TaxID=314023 RepID=A0AA40EZ90_9PEZI|nr:hypothetical protein B0T21DRAFT_355927 [Apiosordaria backusii]